MGLDLAAEQAGGGRDSPWPVANPAGGGASGPGSATGTPVLVTSRRAI
jgi:hypothetical protein